ncbi:MAG: site-specific integrase [Nitrosopumilus sp.]|nr:site-specific integrase [Nitrosopumilus sp.]
MKNSASIKPILYIHKELKNGKYPVIIQIIKDRKVKKISLGYSAKKDEWDFRNNKPSKKHPERKELEAVINKKMALLSKQVLALDLETEDYSAKTVVTKVKRKRVSVSVIEYFDEVVKALKKANRIGNSEIYQTCKNVLLTYSDNKELSFAEIDYSFLNKLENSWRGKGWKEISISAYMRTLRALFNRAIKEEIIPTTMYPFKTYKVGKLNTTTQKRALNREQITAIENLELPLGTAIWHAQQIFLFSYYTMGTNFVDIANLTQENISSEQLQYTRTKTHKLYNTPIHPKAKEILNYYVGIQNDKYIFPIYSEETHITAQQKANRLHKVMQRVNKDLKKIAEKCKIKETLTTYVARHSSATMLKREGISTSKIKDLLGHETEEITQVYLDSFENSELTTAVNLL